MTERALALTRVGPATGPVATPHFFLPCRFQTTKAFHRGEGGVALNFIVESAALLLALCDSELMARVKSSEFDGSLSKRGQTS